MVDSAVIVDAIRTPSGKGKTEGQLSGVHPAELLSHTLQALLSRTGIDAALVDDVIGGCVGQAGEQALNITRHAVLGAGFPESVPATTIDRQCGSSQQAAHFAAQSVLAGAHDIVIACGVESMSRVPMGTAPMGQDAAGPAVAARYPEGLVNQGVSAELIAARWKLDRAELDAFAARSHSLAAATAANGGFDREILPVPIIGTDGGSSLASSDETIRPETTAEGLGNLKPSFRSDRIGARFPEIGWQITPGNSSPLTDGASAVLIMSEEKANVLGLRPRARFHSFAVTGSDPLLMLTGVIPATRMVLERAGLTIDQIDAYEVNEAFAPVPMVWQRELDTDPDKLNPRGGAIALGHPLGASGTRLLTTLVNHLEATGGRYGLQTMCEGGGMANATVIERL
ncbi:thiolase family protein [Saccharopolyspora sp. ASAGF58]|uniref:thiolase family protein n=1 Tax=Saccharopolyspora sp. ASAGF58 TaxID=2719023 RepID=UPI00143FC480|nr:thiolase family protein [Saccharopolyspora sp. ASAGF58]QIZ38006.1 thiolase family protein [Saccharopolyspora sp. ASAGF58]